MLALERLVWRGCLQVVVPHAPPSWQGRAYGQYGTMSYLLSWPSRHPQVEELPFGNVKNPDWVKCDFVCYINW